MLFNRLPGDYVYVKLNEGERQNTNSILFLFQESEGPNCVMLLEEAIALQKQYTFLCTVFQLKENTSLHAVGITAKVSTALAKNNIPCNVVAALQHDYFLIPKESAEEAFLALKALENLQ